MAYPEAAAALADCVSEAAGVAPGDVVLEAGSGRGDNVLRLLERFGASRVLGLNLSPAETEAARGRLRAEVLEGRASLRQGDVGSLLGTVAPASVDRVVAVDCAYHFVTRASFLRSASRALRDGGGLAAADIVAAPVADASMLQAAGWLFGIPAENLRTAAELESDFVLAGFSQVSIADRTDVVIAGFAAHARGQMLRGGAVDGLAFLLVGVVMTLLTWSGLFRYVIAKGVARSAD